MQYYYPTPGAVQGLSGVREEAAKFVTKIRTALDSLNLGTGKLDETQAKIDALVPLVNALPDEAERNSAGSQIDSWIAKLTELRGKIVTSKTDLGRLWEELKKVLGLSGNGALSGETLGIVWYILVGLVGAALVGAAQLWNSVVNETRRINLEADALKAVVEGKLPPEVLRDLKKEGRGFLDWLPKLAIAAVVLFALPGLVKMRRRGA